VRCLSDRAQPCDQSGNQGEDRDLGSDLNGRGKSQCDEPAKTLQIRLHRCFQQFGFVMSVVPQQIPDQHHSEVSA
jgi:hypothetical protein